MNKAIAVEYNLYRDTATGELIESTEGKAPLAFLSGLGQMIPEFEANITGLNEGDTFSFGIKSENAYGSRKEEAVIELAQDMFMNEGKLIPEVVVDNILPLQDQNENVIPGKILSINEETITVDFGDCWFFSNHCCNYLDDSLFIGDKADQGNCFTL